jgi:hypothetical protein
LYASLWRECTTDMKAFVIMHLLGNEDDCSEPWCVLVVDNVKNENVMIQDILENCDGISLLRQCIVEQVPFHIPDEIRPNVMLVACF